MAVLNQEKYETQDIKTKLYCLIDEIIDTVATFDGRFSFTLTDTSGAAKMAFHGLNGTRYLTVMTKMGELESVQISLQYPAETDDNDSMVIYSGSFEESVIRYQIGHHIANWYAQSVRALESR